MNTTAKKTIAFVAASGAIAAATWMGTHRAHATTAPTAPTAPTAVAPEPERAAIVAPAPALPERRFRPGDSFVYEVVASRALTTGDKAQGFDATLRAKLAITVAGRDDEGALLRAELRSPEWKGASALSKAAAESLVKPVYVKALWSGELRSFSFAKGTPAEVAGLLKGLMASLQVVAPGGGVAGWRATERDTTGEYEAAYTRTPRGVHKSKKGYLRANGAAGLQALLGKYEVSSSIDVDIDETGWPRALTEDETLDVTVAAAHVTSKSKTGAMLLGVEARPDLVGAADPAGLVSDVESEAEGFDRARTNAERGLVAGRSFKQIAAAFHAPEVAKRNDAMVAMGALFRQEPEAASEAGDALSKGKLDAESAARVAGALGAAGTPEAQRALAAVLASPDASSSQMVQAVTALGQSSNQIDDNEAALKKAMGSDASDVSAAAAYALGSSIHTRNADASGDTSPALQTLLDGLSNATTDADRRVFLLALGNTGDPKALDAIEPYLTDADMDLRVAATTALRLIPGQRADDDILTALGDSAYPVRRAAVDTLRFRPSAALLPAIEQMVRTDPSDAVRSVILSVLFAKGKDDPAAYDAIRWAAQNDPSDKVREIAKSFVNLMR